MGNQYTKILKKKKKRHKKKNRSTANRERLNGIRIEWLSWRVKSISNLVIIKKIEIVY